MDVGVTFERRERPERDAHERGLPAPVRPDYGVKLAKAQGQRHARQRIGRRAGVAVPDIVQSDHTFFMQSSNAAAIP